MDANKEELGLTPANEKMMMGGMVDVSNLLDRRAAIAGAIAQVASAFAGLLTNPAKDAVAQVEGFWRRSIPKRFLVAAFVMTVPKIGTDNPEAYVLAAPVWQKGGMPVGARVVIRYRFAGSDVWSVDLAERVTAPESLIAGDKEFIQINGKKLIPQILGVESVEDLQWCYLTLPAMG